MTHPPHIYRMFEIHDVLPIFLPSGYYNNKNGLHDCANQLCRGLDLNYIVCSHFFITPVWMNVVDAMYCSKNCAPDNLFGYHASIKFLGDGVIIDFPGSTSDEKTQRENYARLRSVTPSLVPGL